MERLSSRKIIGSLFEKGSSLYSYPFTIAWMEGDPAQQYPARVAISVPKKRLKRAVDRNRVKRVVREAWRHNKTALYEALEQQKIKIVLMLIYTGHGLPSQADINNAIEKVILKLLIAIKEANPCEER